MTYFLTRRIEPGGLVKRAAPAFLATLLVTGLTACGEDESTTHPSPSPTRSAPQPRTSEEFEASANAETARVQASASAALRDASGQGNAMADVGQRGVPTAQTDGLRAALVTVTNSTNEAAFYSVQVDFVDGQGKTLDSVVVGFDKVGPGAKAQRYAISKKAGDVKTFPRIVKAQRDAVG